MNNPSESSFFRLIILPPSQIVPDENANCTLDDWILVVGTSQEVFAYGEIHFRQRVDGPPGVGRLNHNQYACHHTIAVLVLHN